MHMQACFVRFAINHPLTHPTPRQGKGLAEVLPSGLLAAADEGEKADLAGEGSEGVGGGWGRAWACQSGRKREHGGTVVGMSG